MNLSLAEYIKKLARENPPSAESGVQMPEHVEKFFRDRVTATVFIHSSFERKNMRAYYLAQDGNEISGLFYTEDGNEHYFAIWDNEVSFFKGYRFKLKIESAEVPLEETVIQTLRRDPKELSQTVGGPIFLTTRGWPVRLNPDKKPLLWLRLDNGKMAWVYVTRD
jgi:hypothetical protein